MPGVIYRHPCTKCGKIGLWYPSPQCDDCNDKDSNERMERLGRAMVEDLEKRILQEFLEEPPDTPIIVVENK